MYMLLKTRRELHLTREWTSVNWRRRKKIVTRVFSASRIVTSFQQLQWACSPCISYLLLQPGFNWFFVKFVFHSSFTKINFIIWKIKITKNTLILELKIPKCNTINIFNCTLFLGMSCHFWLHYTFYNFLHLYNIYFMYEWFRYFE